MSLATAHAPHAKGCFYYTAGSEAPCVRVTSLIGTLPGDCVRLMEPTYFHATVDRGVVSYQRSLGEGDAVWGLGQSMGPVNKRSGRYRMFATDEPLHLPDRQSLYGSHPFFILDGATKLGVLVDYPGEINIDCGFTERDLCVVSLADAPHRLIFFEGESVAAIIAVYLRVVGSPYVPPKWAFGYHQSRWSYPDKARVLEVAKRMRAEGIPCDSIFLDLDYMDDYKVFTTSEERFADFPEFVAELKQMGMRLVPIIDPGVKIQKGFKVYEEFMQADAFLKNVQGEPYAVAVWPGYTHLPDFLRKDARACWASQHQALIAMGIEGFWIDMNEPALFFTSELTQQLKAGFTTFMSLPDPGMHDFFAFTGALHRFSSRRDVYNHLYHSLDDGTKVCHEQVHNLYAYGMAEATAEAFNRFLPQKRHFLISRSSCIGSHRTCGIWTGDNHSWWEHMLSHMRMLVSLGLSGFFFAGADVGGFGGDASGELLTRWSQLAIVSPLFRNHSAISGRFQEPWAFDELTLHAVKEAIRLRYALMPYLYSEFMQAVMHSMPVVRPLWLQFPKEPLLKDVDDQILYGSALMIAPILQPGARSRTIILPAHRWLLWRARRYEELSAMKVLNAGTHTIAVAYDEVALLLAENSMIASCAPQQYVAEKPLTQLTLIAFITDRARYRFYDDDGVRDDSLQNHHGIIEIEIIREGNDYRLQMQRVETGDFRFAYTEITAEIFDENGGRTTVNRQF